MPRLIQDVLIPLVEFKKWKGVDNLATDDMRVPPGFVRTADNVDIDSEDMMHMRKGILESIISGACHSLWSDEADLCFAVLANNLIQINKDWSYTVLLSGVGPSKMNFLQVEHKVFFSNIDFIGYIENSVAHAFPELSNIPQNTFKQRMVGGSLIEYFNSRLYAAQDETIYHSDAGSPMIMDKRKNLFVVGGPITMMLAVIDGFYISAGSKVVFAHYQGEVEFPIEHGQLAIPDFKYRKLLDVPALKGSAIAIERIDLGKSAPIGYRGVIGRVIIFATSIGIFMGLPGGHIHDCTSDHYAVYDIEEGASLIKWHNGYRQYIYVGQAPAGVGLINLNAVDLPDTALITAD